MLSQSRSRRALWRVVACSTVLASLPVGAEPLHSFGALAGAWEGHGTITLLTGVEHATCEAAYQVAGTTAKLSLDCTTESYRLNLTSAVVDKLGTVSGEWVEHGFGTSGNVSGRSDGDKLDLRTNVAGAQVTIVIAIQRGRQTVSFRTTSPLLSGGDLVLLRQN